MIVRIEDASNSNFYADFYTTLDFKARYSHRGFRGSCYPSIARDDKIFQLRTHQGFYSQPKSNPYTNKGLGENGVNFITSSLSAKQISWTFVNVFDSITNQTPNEYLARLLTTTRPLLVTVTLKDKTYKQYFHVLEDTDTETGDIVLESSNPGEGLFWYCGETNAQQYYYTYGKGFLTLNMPQYISSARTEQPIKISLESGGILEPIITIDQTYKKGENTPTKYIVTSEATGDSFTLTSPFQTTNDLADLTLIVDCANKSVVNADGVSRTDYFEGNYIQLTPGTNIIDWTVDDGEWKPAGYFPQDLNINIQYADLALTVGGTKGGSVS